MANKEEIFERVKKCLIDALGVDDDEVELDSSLTNDLGAESIDFLDIVFRLEKEFGIKIPRTDLFPENLLTNPNFVKDGKMTEAGLEELEKKLPYADLTEFKKNPLVSEIPNLFTVKMLVDYIASKLDEG